MQKHTIIFYINSLCNPANLSLFPGLIIDSWKTYDEEIVYDIIFFIVRYFGTIN